MKILFVCQRNNGRSQIAEGLYNSMTRTKDADSAGVEVNKDGQLLKDRAAEPGSEVGRVIEVMAEAGVDISNAKRTQHNRDMMDGYDKIIAIMDPGLAPEYLKDYPKVEFWNIDDPKAKDLNGVRRTRDEIKSRINAL